MNEIQIFEHEAFGQIRVIDQDGEPWFVAEDVCRALNIANTTDALTRLDEDEKARFNLGLPGRDTNCVNEPGLYSLVLGSRKPEAKAFEPTPVTLVLPDSYKAATAFIKHVKDNGDKYVYEGKITGIAPRKLEFISEHGFSSFTVSAEKPVLDQSSDATLSEVKAGEYTVTKSGNDYTVNVPEGADVTKLPLTLTATDSKVQGITVNGTAYTAGMEIDLTTAAKIVVTAEDGTTAEYTLTAVVGADPQPWTNPYTDVKEGDWFYDAVKYVNQNGLMEGTSATKFSPRSDLTRGMFAQILYNAAGKPSVTWTNKFSDV